MGANGSCVWTGQCLRNLLDISVAKAGGYSGIESGAEVQAGDIHWQGGSSMWVGSEL